MLRDVTLSSLFLLSAPSMAFATDTAPDPDPAPTIDIEHFVVSSMALAPRGEGYDLDGDGSIDHSLGAFGGMINGFIASEIASTDKVAVAEVAWDDTQVDTANVGLLTGLDTDGDPSDNYNGSEVFEALADSLDSNGQPRLLGEAQVDGDNFSATLPSGEIQFAGLTLNTASEVLVDGTFDGDTVRMSLGFAMSMADFESVLDKANLGSLSWLLSGLADLDTDGDGDEDAFSMSMVAEGVPCSIVMD